MPPKHLNSNAKRTRPRAPGVKAGLELMATLGGISVLGTQQTPYYYFPPEKRIRAGVDRCTRCVTACGPKAACNVQPLLRVGTNLWKGRQCYYCTIFPAELQGETCSLDGSLYIFDGDRRRLLLVDAKGEVINRPIDDLDLPELAELADVPSLPSSPSPASAPSLPSPADTPVSIPPPASPATLSSVTAATEIKPLVATEPTVINKEISPIQVSPEASEPAPVPITPVRLSPEWSHAPSPVPAASPAPATVVAPAPVPAPAPVTPAPVHAEAAPECVECVACEPASPGPVSASAPSTPILPALDSASSTPADTPGPSTPTPAITEYQWLRDDLSLVNRKAKAEAAVVTGSTPAPVPTTLAPAAPIVEAPEAKATKPVPVVPAAEKPAPAKMPVEKASEAKPVEKAAPTPVEQPTATTDDPLAQLAVSRRPLAALNALSSLLEAELAQLRAANAEVERLRALVRAKDAERSAKAARVEQYRCAIDTALTALEEERSSLMRMRGQLAAALAAEL